jgi:NADH:ubiquinone oxidoreductase subunit 6 (subunit J)
MFLAFALMTLGGALALLMQRSAVQAGLCMMLSFFGMAGLFVLLANPVAAALQVIVYGGAITVLVLFVVMLLQTHAEEPPRRRAGVQKWLSAVLVAGLAFAAVRLVAGSSTIASLQQSAPPPSGMTLHRIGEQLFSGQLVALEAVGLILLSAMICAVVLVKREY